MAQTTQLQKTIDPGLLANFTFSKHIACTDGGFIVLANYKSGTSTFSYDVVLKIDKTGQHKWTKVHEGNAGYGFTQILATPDSGCVLVGLEEASTNVPRTWLKMTKLDNAGNTVWGQTYRGADFQQSFAQINNNKIYVGGTYSEDLQGDTNIYLLITDLQGDINGFDSREAIRGETITGITETDNGNIYLCGTTKFNNPQSNPLIITFDQNNNFEFYHDIPLGGENTIKGITAIDNGGAWITGTNKTAGINTPFLSSLGYGNTLVTYTKLLPTNNFIPEGITRTKDRRLLIFGAFERNVFGHTQSGLVKFNQGMILEWAKSYGDTTTNYKRFVSVKEMGNGDLSAVGPINLNNYYGAHLVTTASNGTNDCKQYTETLQIESTPYTQSTRYVAAQGPLSIPFAVASISFFSTLNTIQVQDVCTKDTCIAGFINNNDTVCLGASITITDTTKFATTYRWQFENATPATYTDKAPPTITFTKAGNHKIRLIAANSISADTVEQYIKVWPLPLANAGKDSTICLGDSIALNATGGSTYLWAPATFISSTTISKPIIWSAQKTTYTVQVTDANGCKADDSLTISVINPPIPQGFDTTICLDKLVVLNAGNPGFNYLWSNGSKTQSITAKPGDYRVIISNSCFVDTAYYTITGEDCQLQFYIPNSFTPNGDGLNDVFFISGENIARVELKIYNRWGETMFSGQGTRPYWDGTYNEIPCPINPYIYIAEVTGVLGTKNTVSGIVTLVR